MFFLMCDMAKCHSFYKWSLESLVVVVGRAITSLSFEKDANPDAKSKPPNSARRSDFSRGSSNPASPKSFRSGLSYGEEGGCLVLRMAKIAFALISARNSTKCPKHPQHSTVTKMA